MEPTSRDADARELARRADRLDALAEIADLMGDGEGAARWRTQAWIRRLEAMALLDD